MRIGACIDQLHIHPNFVASSLHRPLEDSGNTELLRDGLQVTRLALILGRRGSRNDFEVPNRRQFRENLILYALGEIGVFFFSAEILEWQHRDRFVDFARRGQRQEKKSRSDRDYYAGNDQESNITAAMPSRSCRGGLNSLRRHVVSPGEDQCDGKTDQQKHNDETQRPVRQFPCRKNRRSNLNDESRSDDIGRRNAINFPPLQLVEQTAHKHPGLILTSPTPRVYEKICTSWV